MENLKKIFFLILTSILVLILLTGCQDEEIPQVESNKIRVAASPTPHALILERVKDILKEQGYTLEIIEYKDYIQPNIVVNNGLVDANFFQHKPYLDNFNKENKTKLVSVAQIHFEPLGIYAGRSSDIKYINNNATIAIPNDASNRARALLLLERNGLIKLRIGASLTASQADIIRNPYGIYIVEIEARQIYKVIPNVDFIVLNGNYALSAGLNVLDALSLEEQDSEAAQTYANIIAVKEGDQNRKAVIALIEALKDKRIKQYINDTFRGSVVPIE
jgi:D-methionine transport system substrate-binding protein